MSGPAPHVWFLDTASLLSMAVHPDVAAAVLAEIGQDPVIITDVVVGELHHRTDFPKTAVLARTALGALLPTWLTLDTSVPGVVSLEATADAQEEVADGRVLDYDYQHWAESTYIAMGRASAKADHASVKVLLSEDYDARRVAATVAHMEGLSIHGLLHRRVHANKMTAAEAAALAEVLAAVHRGPLVTADEFADPTGRRLGRVGMP